MELKPGQTFVFAPTSVNLPTTHILPRMVPEMLFLPHRKDPISKGNTPIEHPVIQPHCPAHVPEQSKPCVFPHTLLSCLDCPSPASDPHDSPSSP